MAERIAYLQAVVGADISSFRYAMQRVRNDVGILGAGINRVSEAARLATYTISAPLALVGASFSKAAIQFDAAMRDVNSKALLTESQLQNLRTEVLSYSNEVRAGATQVAEALAVVYGAGVKNQAEATEIMQAALKASEATVASVETTTEAVVSILNSFGRETMTAAKASDALVQLFQDGIGEMSSFANGVARLNPQIVALGVTIEEAYAAYAYLTQAGLGASEASTALNQAFVGLVKPTEAMKSALQQLGVQSGTQLIHKFGGLMEALRQLSAVSGITADDVNAIFGNIRGARAAQILFNNLDRASEMVVEFQENVDGATDRSWEQQMKSMSAQLDLLNSAFQNLAIRMGDVQFPIMQPIVKGFTDFVKALSDADIQTMQYATTLGALIIAIPPVTWFLTSMATAASLVSLSVVGIATAISSNFLGVRDTFMRIVNDMTGGLGELYDALKRIVDFSFDRPIDPPEITPVEDTGLVDSTMSFTVDTKSIYDQWEEELSDQISWTDFWELIKDQPTGIGDTVTFQLPVSIKPVVPTVGNQNQVNTWLDYIDNWFNSMNGTGSGPSSAIYQGAFMDFYTYEPPEKTFFDKVIEAFKKELPTFEAELIRIGDSIRSYIISMFTSVGNSLSSGNIPGLDFRLSDILFEILTFDVAGFFSQAGGTDFGQSIKTLFTGIGDYIVNTGLPELSRMSGMLAAKLVLLVNDAIQLASSILSGGDPSELLTTLGDSFVEGYNKVMDERKGDITLPSGLQISTDSEGGNLGAELADSLYLAIMGAFTASAIFQKLLPLGMLFMAGLKGAFLTALSYYGIGQIILGALGLEFQEMDVESIGTAIGVGLIATKVALGLKSALTAAFRPGGGAFSARSIGTSVATAGGLTLITGLVAGMFGDVDPAALALEFGALVAIDMIGGAIVGAITSKIGEKVGGGAAAGIGGEIAESIAEEITDIPLEAARRRLATPEIDAPKGALGRLADSFKSLLSSAIASAAGALAATTSVLASIKSGIAAAVAAAAGSAITVPALIIAAAAVTILGTAYLLKSSTDGTIDTLNIEAKRTVIDTPDIGFDQLTEDITPTGFGNRLLDMTGYFGLVYGSDLDTLVQGAVTNAFTDPENPDNIPVHALLTLYAKVVNASIVNPAGEPVNIAEVAQKALDENLLSESELAALNIDLSSSTLTMSGIAENLQLSEGQAEAVRLKVIELLEGFTSNVGVPTPTAETLNIPEMGLEEALNFPIELRPVLKQITSEELIAPILEMQIPPTSLDIPINPIFSFESNEQDELSQFGFFGQGSRRNFKRQSNKNVPVQSENLTTGGLAGQISSYIDSQVATVASPYPVNITMDEPTVSFGDSFATTVQTELVNTLASVIGDIMPYLALITIGINTIEFTAGFMRKIEQAVRSKIQEAVDNIGIDNAPTGPTQGTGNKATGGMLTAGHPYIVGEAGRELFIPSTSGKLIPAFRTNEMIRSARSGGGGTTTVNVVINGVQNVDQFVSEMKRRGYDIGRR